MYSCGSMRNVNSLTIPGSGRKDEALDVLIKMMPRLKRLDFSGYLSHIYRRGVLAEEHKARLQEVAELFPELKLRI